MDDYSSFLLYSNPMRENYTLTRLYIEAPLIAGESLDLSKAQVHFLGTVLRKEEGDAIRIFNGHDGEWRAEISAISKKTATLKITEQLRVPKPCPDIILCFAPVKKHRTNFIFEKATELGVSAIIPVITARTQFPKLNLDKAHMQTIEAAEQTERLDVPTIHPVQKLEAMLNGWGNARTLIFADEAGDAKPALDALTDVKGPSAILIGPEGGFTSKERDILRTHKFVVPVSLGPRILRSDTAALSLLTLWQAVHGDWT